LAGFTRLRLPIGFVANLWKKWSRSHGVPIPERVCCLLILGECTRFGWILLRENLEKDQQTSAGVMLAEDTVEDRTVPEEVEVVISRDI
jgi:hypothetical protein